MFNTEGASCIGLEPEMFFEDYNMSPRQERMLREICLACPVFDDCLDYSLHVKVHGFWAGTLPKQRTDLRQFFGIKPMSVHDEYKRGLRSQTRDASKKQASRERFREAE